MEFKSPVIETIKNFCENNGYEFRDDYSGRCMFGRECVGYVTDDPLMSLVYLSDSLRDEFTDCQVSELLGNQVLMDSMGLSTIIYFPYLINNH